MSGPFDDPEASPVSENQVQILILIWGFYISWTQLIYNLFTSLSLLTASLLSSPGPKPLAPKTKSQEALGWH